MEPTPIHPTPAPNSSTRRPLLYTDDLDHFDAISIRLGITGTAAQRFHGLLEWVQQQIDGDLSQATVVLPVLSDQAKTLAWLTEEISSLRQQLATAQQDALAARTLRSERSILQAKIDSLSGENLTLRRRLERFDSLRQALMGGSEADSPTQNDSTSPEASQTSPDAPGATEAPDSTITAPLQRRPASAQERAARIWQTIQEWNETPGRPQDEKIALSASTLEKRFGIYRPAAQQVHGRAPGRDRRPRAGPRHHSASPQSQRAGICVGNTEGAYRRNELKSRSRTGAGSGHIII